MKRKAVEGLVPRVALIALMASGCATMEGARMSQEGGSQRPVQTTTASVPTLSEAPGGGGAGEERLAGGDVIGMGASESGPVSLRLVAIGDVNFNRNRMPVDESGVDVFGTRIPFEHFVAGLDGAIDGDLNFANIETVVTDRNDFDPPDSEKQYCFRSHVRGLDVLAEAGFNLFCLANNHAYDYGETGILETLSHIRALPVDEVYGWSGIGRDLEEANRPALFEVKGVRVAFLAIGIAGNVEAQAREGHAGVAHVSRYQEGLGRLRDAPADLRILSLHDGKEGVLYPTDRQLKVSREAISEFGVHVVIGHHSHRVQGIERYRGGVIVYSLGNGIMRGAADITGRRIGGLYADFGLLIRMDLLIDKETHLVSLERLEAVPLIDMHDRPHPLEPGAAAARIETLNRISARDYLGQEINASCPPGDEAGEAIFQPHGNFGVLDLR